MLPKHLQNSSRTFRQHKNELHLRWLHNRHYKLHPDCGNAVTIRLFPDRLLERDRVFHALTAQHEQLDDGDFVRLLLD